jgi:DNA-binding Lrp family transcriptional regulator
MHPRRPRADAREDVGGNIGKFDRCMHFCRLSRPCKIYHGDLPVGGSRGGYGFGLRVALGPGMTSRFACYKHASDGSEVRMVPFFVQIKCQLGKSYEVANRLADAEIASEIYSTAGDFDLLVKFYVEQATDIGHFIAQKVQTIPGIADTRTIITFKAFGGS